MILINVLNVMKIFIFLMEIVVKKENFLIKIQINV